MDGEGDGVLSEVGDLPRTEGPVVGAAVQSVDAIVELRAEGLVADGVLAASDAVYVATGDGIVDGVRGILGW